MENLDTIPSYDMLEVREQRKAAVNEVLSHLDHLDGLMATAWAQHMEKAAAISEPSIIRSSQALTNKYRPIVDGHQSVARMVSPTS